MEPTAISAYVAALEAMRPETIDDVLVHCADDVRFTDSFNDVTGKPALRHVFADMFEKVSDLSFAVHDRQGTGARWLLTWTYAGRLGRLGHVTIEGMSRVDLDADGRVRRHADFWDGGEIYRRVPVVGAVNRAIMRRVAATG
ncbi:nuclear transport factor 2 family protein [Microbaculum marinum]|uniref:Nuclear transport factor 2 family protein n=1 Tax=Microbaculum marinum TaxID=1764581 RepID=A0AAW9RKF6_9HYPH